ncbi:hypothetical protein Vadar_008361 [Vaccinium darrowii]|uniref:Uncharacterized protein n=1 Tax=Vaccinium darrowii TaxID=229202 RepID=A0ACB7WYP7_9ERIC|nr:hypothetical protein Vadar_008361 [Vaccinium darrowii]
MATIELAKLGLQLAPLPTILLRKSSPRRSRLQFRFGFEPSVNRRAAFLLRPPSCSLVDEQQKQGTEVVSLFNEQENALVEALIGIQGRGRSASPQQLQTTSTLIEGRWQLMFTTRPGTASPIHVDFMLVVDFFAVIPEFNTLYEVTWLRHLPMPHLDGLRKFVVAEPVRASPPRLALMLKTLADTTSNAPVPMQWNGWCDNYNENVSDSADDGTRDFTGPFPEYNVELNKNLRELILTIRNAVRIVVIHSVIGIIPNSSACSSPGYSSPDSQLGYNQIPAKSGVFSSITGRRGGVVSGGRSMMVAGVGLRPTEIASLSRALTIFRSDAMSPPNNTGLFRRRMAGDWWWWIRRWWTVVAVVDGAS